MDKFQTLSAPLTAPFCDLRDFPFMPLMVAQFRDSDLAADETPEVCWAAILIQAASWHQLPAGSIPDDDNWIAKAANYRMRGKTDRAWHRVRRGALHGWVKCSDGRLYHPDVARKANDAWDSKLKQRYRTECARLAKMNPPAPKPEYAKWVQDGCPVGRDGDKLLNQEEIQGAYPLDSQEALTVRPLDAQVALTLHPLDVQGTGIVEVEVEVEGKGKGRETAYATGQSPVAPCAQAHATPPSEPPVDNSIGTAGSATVCPEDHPEDAPKEANDAPTEPPKEPPQETLKLANVPAAPDTPPKAGRKKSMYAALLLGVDDVVAEGADRRHAEDWMATRKSKGVDLTRSELDANKREADKAGISFAEAVKICAENSWRGFKAAYLANMQNRTGNFARPSLFPEHVPAGAIPLVRSTTMQSAAIAKQLIFKNPAPVETERRV